MKKLFTLLSLFVFAELNAANYYVKFKEGFLAQHFAQKSFLNLRKEFQQQVGDKAEVGTIRQVAPSLSQNGLNRLFFVSVSNLSLSDLQKISSVESAESVPEYFTSLTPNDPQIFSQWHLQTINAFNAWNVNTGSAGVTVAIVDNAVMRNHQDLATRIYTNPGEIANNNIDDDGNGYIDDVQGWDAADNDNNPNPPDPTFNHGTHCAGISCAASNNNIGIASIGYNCSIVPVKATADSSSPRAITDPASGVAYAIAAGADVVSMSFGGGGYSSFMQQLFNTGFAQGIVFVAAAGNSNSSQQHYPAAYNHVISVAASNPSDQKASFSNYGTWVDISAPGTGIFSTLPNTTTGTYGSMSGTSMACPLVAGLCALMKANTPSLTPTQLETCLKQSADNIDALNPTYIGELGAGRINALAALNCQACNAVASFTSTNNVVSYVKNSNVCFTANGNGSSFSWSINGNNYSGNSACYTFTNAGYYNVCNYVTGSFAGCADTLCKSFTIYDTTGITVCAPRYGNKWIFGLGASLDFSAEPPISGGPVSGFTGGEAASSVSDACGNLQCYTNGTTAFDRNYQAMPNGTGLTGNISTSNGAVFVPMPGNRNKYYLFTMTDASQNTANDGCYYHIIDMTLPGNGTVSNPRGNVLLKNQPLLKVSDYNAGVSEKMEVIRHANGTDFWLILHNNYGSSFTGPFNKFYVYRISPTGISGPDVYSAGNAFPTNIQGIGDMDANSQGTKLAVCAIEQYGSPDGFIQLFDFNKSTGAITNPVNVATGLFNNYGLAFSPDGQNLFYNVANTSFTLGEIKMYRLPTAITSSVASNIAHVPMGLQIGPDGRIYICNVATASGSWPGTLTLSTINNPNSATAAGVNYLYENIGLTAQTRLNLPFFIKSDMISIPPQVSANDTICVSDTSQFNVDVEICSGLDGVLSYAWNFNDPASGANNISALKSPKHKFSVPGLYQVKIIANASCYSDSITIPVLVRNCTSTTEPVVFEPSIDTVGCPIPDSISVNIGGGMYYRMVINGTAQPLKFLDMPSGTFTTVKIPVAGNVLPMNICAVFYDDTTQAANDTVCRIISAGSALPPTLVDTNVCSGGNIVLNAGGGWDSYLWSTGAPTQTTIANAAGLYVVTVTNTSGCSATADVNVTADDIILTVALQNTTCGSSNGLVTISASNGTAPYSYVWSTTSNNDTISNLAAGTYTVTVHDFMGCSSTASAIVNPSGAGSVNLTADKTIMCSGDSAYICADAGYTSYLWNTGLTSRCIYTKLAGNYYVTASDGGSCTATSGGIAVAVYPIPSVSISVNGDTLTAFNATSYQWYYNNVIIPGATSNVYVVLQTGDYMVVVTDSNGCRGSSTKVGIVLTGLSDVSGQQEIKVYPNPNSVGTWQLEVGNEFIGSEVEVFDLDGRVVFKSLILNPKSAIEFDAASGIYLMRVISEKGTVSRKLVKL